MPTTTPPRFIQWMGAMLELFGGPILALMLGEPVFEV
jgi:hypothetical protein